MSARAPALLLALALAAPAAAELRIDVVEGGTGGVPVAVVPFVWDDPGRVDTLAEVVAADLADSGFFAVLAPDELPQADLRREAFDWARWRGGAAGYAVTAELSLRPDGRVRIDYRLRDLLREQTVLRERQEAPPRLLRRMAHRIADAVHRQIAGVPGAFDTRIAYVERSRRAGRDVYRLYVADADGHAPAALLESPRPLLSPAWAPGGETLAYVSYELGRPQVIVQNLRTGERRVAPAPGASASAPAFSPDGAQLALAMTIDGDTEIFLHHRAAGTLRRFTYSPGIDTEPTWEPDGRALVFTSDRSGRPRLYRQALDGAAAALAIPGRYAADADVAPGGRMLAFVQSRPGGGFGISLHEPAGGALHVLSSGRLDESPSFAPNGLRLLYAGTAANGERVLMLASHNAKILKRLTVPQRDVREPAWSPYRN